MAKFDALYYRIGVTHCEGHELIRGEEHVIGEIDSEDARLVAHADREDLVLPAGQLHLLRHVLLRKATRDALRGEPGRPRNIVSGMKK